MTCAGCKERRDRFIELMERLFTRRKDVNNPTPDELAREQIAIEELQ